MKEEINNKLKKISRKYIFKNEIRSDFSLLLFLFKTFLIYILSLPFNLIFILFYFIFYNKLKFEHYFSKVFLEPFKIVNEFSTWFFEAKYTGYLIIFLYIIFLLEYILFLPLGIINNLKFSFFEFINGNYYSIISSIFLHADFSHIISNTIGILIFGRIVEKHFKSNLLWIFLFSGIIANFISGYFYFISGDLNLSLGASGGLAGLIMFAILLEPFAFSTIFIFPLPIFIIAWFFIYLDFINMFDKSNINHIAHLAGYSCILIFFFFLNLKNKNKITKGVIINIILLLFTFFLVKYFSINLF